MKMNVKKTERDGIVRAYPENGKPLAWSASSGVELIEKDGLYFKDLEKTGELLPYEDWRLPVEERAADLASRLTTEEIAGLMLYSPHQAVPPMAFGPFGGTYNGQKYAEANAPAYTLTDQQKEFMNKEHIRHVLMITVEDAKTAAKWNNELQKLALGEDGRVLTENITYQTKNGAVYVTSRCVCLENIAQEAPLTLPEEPENSENIGVFVGNVQGNG